MAGYVSGETAFAEGKVSQVRILPGLLPCPDLKTRLSANRGIPVQRNKNPRRCDKGTHGRSADRKKERHPVFEYQQVF